MGQTDGVAVVMNGHLPQSNPIDVPKLRKVDTNGGDSMSSSQNDKQARIAFLDIRQDNVNNRGLSVSPERSPCAAKPFVPPLDFSTLHENVGMQGNYTDLFSQPYKCFFCIYTCYYP